jgi:hypothetical protein
MGISSDANKSQVRRKCSRERLGEEPRKELEQMADLGGCYDVVKTLNLVFGTKLILNDGHEILARLREGDDMGRIVMDLGQKFRSFRNAAPAQGAAIARAWPPLHREAVSQMVTWALSKLDDDDQRIWIKWRADADHPETVTRFALAGRTLEIELAHPPGPLA